MTRSYLDAPIPVAAPATAPGEAALAVVRASGPGCIELAAACFSRPAELLAAPGHSLVHGNLIHPGTGEAVDEVLAAVFRAPRSFTGEDSVEFSCHGSPVTLRRALAALEAAGFAPALPGEFAFRAFTNGKADLVRAEAIDELVHARSEGAREGALLRLEGGLSRRLESARSELLGIMAGVELRLDYGEDEAEAAAGGSERAALAALRDSLSGLAAGYRAGRLYRDGVRVVLAGPVNAGKSSLFNLILREERSIVSHEPGTTRDWIEAGFELAGFPVRLLDTAGLREANSVVEAEGIARSRRLLSEAELVLYVVDGTRGADQADEASFASRSGILRVWNKVDSSAAIPAPEGYLAVSAATGLGLPGLITALEEGLRSLAGLGPENRFPPGKAGGPAEGELRIASERQKLLLDRSVLALDGAMAALDANGADCLDILSLELREAADALGEITGEIAAPEVLEAIFSRFCVGK